MRKVMLQHLRELWAVVMDRRHSANNEAKRAAFKDEWLKLSRILANMKNCRDELMLRWVTVQLKPFYTIKSQLGQWRKLRRLQVATGGQRGITSYFAHTTCTRTARNAQTADDGPAAAATAASSPAATAAGQTTTAATASQLRRLAKERTSEQKGKRRSDADRTTTTTLTARRASPRPWQRSTPPAPIAMSQLLWPHCRGWLRPRLRQRQRPRLIRRNDN